MRFHFVAVGVLVLAGIGCVSSGRHTEARIPTVKMSHTPAAVQATITSVAPGQRIQKINPGHRFAGRVYHIYLDAPEGSRLLTVDEHGTLLDDAVVILFSEMPPAVQAAARTAVSGQLQVCRQSLIRPQPTYLVDYLLGDEELVFAIIEANGFIRAVIGYADEDPD